MNSSQILRFPADDLKAKESCDGLQGGLERIGEATTQLREQAPQARPPQHLDEPLNGVRSLMQARSQLVDAEMRHVAADVGQ